MHLWRPVTLMIGLMSLVFWKTASSQNLNTAHKNHFASPSIATIEKIIQRKKPKNIDELLAFLPDSYRRHFVLMYESRSLHKSSITPEFPRIIFFGQDARLILGMTGDPKKPGFQQLEIIQFNDENGAFDFYLADFSKPGTPIEKNPQSCLQCHGNPPRPIWERYPYWPGVYGSIDDKIALGSKEMEYYKNFLQTQRHVGRYTKIGSGTEPFSEKNPSRMRTGQGFMGAAVEKAPSLEPTYFSKPSEHFSQALTYLNGYVRIPNLIFNHSNFSKRKAQLLYVALECDPISEILSEKDKLAWNQFRAGIRDNYVLNRRQNVYELNNYNVPQSNLINQESEGHPILFKKTIAEAGEEFSLHWEDYAKLGFALGLSQEDMRQWSMNQSRGINGIESAETTEITDEDFPFFQLNGAEDAIKLAILEKLIVDPEYAPIILGKSAEKNIKKLSSFELHNFLSNELSSDSERICSELKIKIKKEFATDRNRDSPLKKQESCLASASSAIAIIKRSCLSCHGADGEGGFLDLSSLEVARKFKDSKNRGLEHYIATHKMPPESAIGPQALSADERKCLIEHLKVPLEIEQDLNSSQSKHGDSLRSK